ncbi:MAG: hypothetical protein IK064_07390, partial [Clostridia bacterium]|nr:hypothetical protein [Clostridia bacterium]
MKKIYAIIALILITAMSLSAAACATTHAQEEPAKEQQTAPTSVPFTPTETGEPFGGELGGDNFLPDPGLLHKLGGDFYRIEYTGTNREPVIVSSTKQLRELNIPGFDSATRSSMESKYSDATFASARAAVFGVTFSSGSAVPTVTSIKVED